MDHLPGLINAETVSADGLQQPASPELLRHYQSTHFLAQTMASSAPHIIRLRLDWSEVPLVGPLLLSNLTSDYQAPIIMPDFQQLSFILSN